MIIYRAIVAVIGLGVLIAAASVVVAVGLALVLGAVVFGLASPSRTSASSLRSLYANTREGIDRVQALR